MKRILSLLFSSLLFLPIYAQLNADHNSLRAGDIIVKQQVEFKDPGMAKPNQVWDFSQLQLINDEYELAYSEAPLIGDSVYIMGYNEFSKSLNKHVDLIVGTEHNTMYYFYQTLDSLLLIGHENVLIKQENIFPVISLPFPLNFGQEVSSNYLTRGLYSNTINVSSEGNIKITADDFGKLILPSGDTINPVLRVKTEQTIFDTTKDIITEDENDQGRILRSYKWYSKGYRYPIFETVESINITDTVTLFSTAFVYPPQEHLYLDTDPENLALLDELWEYAEYDNPFTDVGLFKDSKDKKNYSFYPNPVIDMLYVKYTFEKDSPVTISMSTMDGRVVKNTVKKQLQAGEQHEQIDCSMLVAGAYLLKIVAGEVVINEVIIKK